MDMGSYLELHNDGHPFKGCCVPHDPLNIPELRDLLQNPQIIQQEAQKSNSQITSQPILSTPNTSNIAALTDIILMTMDLLPGRRDLEFLLLAFPQWRSRITQIPPVFWRRRCINDYLLLKDALPTVDKMDWQWFYFNVDQMAFQLQWLAEPAASYGEYGADQKIVLEDSGQIQVILLAMNLLLFIDNRYRFMRRANAA